MSSVPKTIKNVMIIDDNDLDHILHKRIFDRTGRIENVTSFIYADEALEYLKGEQCEEIDLIFLDINMPRMNGFEFLEEASQQLGSNFANAVVIMLTTSMAKQDEDRAKNFDIVKAYLSKPLHEDDVNALVDQITSAAA